MIVKLLMFSKEFTHEQIEAGASPDVELEFRGSWKITGPVTLTPRLVWLMNTIQELLKEFKKRNDSATKNESGGKI